jgi:CBS domain-containing protein
MRPLVWADPHNSIGEAAQLLDGADLSCVLVRLPGGLGIATDHDFRASLAVAGLSRQAPLSAICSVPAVTVNEHTDAPAALVVMVERGIHHLVVTDDTGTPVGVVRVVDLASAEVRDPLLVRRSVARARNLGDLHEAAAILPQTVLEMDEIGIPALRVSGILSTVKDLIVQRAVELSPTAVSTELVSWLVLGSLARREALPHSDVDTALAWPTALDNSAPQLRADAELVLESLESCGLSRCPDGANATEPLFSRSVDDWEEATRRWTGHPDSQSALLLASIVADNRPVTHLDLGSALTRSMLGATRDRTFLNALLTFTVAVKPPRGLVGELTVAHSGPHRGQLDLKRGGLRPVVLLGRWMALVTGDTDGSTVDRIRRGAHAGLLTSGEAEDLVGAFEHVYQLCFDQEIAALRSGGTSDSFVAPRDIDPLRRRYLHDSLRAVSQIQTAVRRSWTSGRTVRPGLA